MSGSFSRGAALDELERRFGGRFTYEDGTSAPGVVVEQAAPADYERISLTLVNLGATVLYVRPQGQPSATAGIRLGPGGGTISVSVQEDGLLPCLEWNVLSDAAAGSLYRLEVLRVASAPAGG